MIAAIRSEWVKISSLRSTWLTVAATVISGVALSVLGVADVLGVAPDHLPDSWDPTAISLKGFLFAQLLIGMLGAMAVTLEFGTGQIATSLTFVPSRSRLLAAKSVVVAALAFFVSLITTVISFGTVQLIIAGAGLPAAGLGDPGVLGALADATCYLTLIALLGFAVGALSRSSTSSLAVLVAVLLLVPALGPSLPGLLGKLLGAYWPPTAGQASYAVVNQALAPSAGLAILVISVLAAVAASHVTLRIRDV